ncbi:sugar-binding transcriptional regulator [Caldicellulosiruptor changbaiensis]|uniref:Sugar-binding transcriptional regulator n=1 Tax=Caldicellulosiruptor changbaiensis TaxID=1222016 RepID=A0A3T0D5F5_9FIRM|nr:MULTISPECIES: sugar-binding domain-containing protein [Caldicellulosiruptor]AZT90300.1 sugar-binding transcriptional regulator [Caldicellulosiruptor changbaiensis]
MEDFLELLKRVTPEVIEIFERRYDILKNVKYYQPIGRRMLAERVKLSERIVRNEVDILRSLGLLTITENGTFLTNEGEDILEKLSNIVYDIKGLEALRERVKDILGAKDIIVVPGNADTNPYVLRELGIAAGKVILSLLPEVKIIAVTGGQTVKEVVDNFPRCSFKDILVVPARGGIGQEVEKQANTLAASLAKKLGGKYKLLHLPDTMDEEIYKLIVRKEEVQDVLNDINNADMLIFGIGNAIEMAKRRKFGEEMIEKLKEVGAIGEIFGYYFDKEGNIVYSTTTVGIKLEKIKNIKYMIGVAGGAHKAEAILSLNGIKHNTIFVIDEGIARRILSIKG